MGHALMTAEWEQQQCASPGMNGGPAPFNWAPDLWRFSKTSCGCLD